ncbi:MAG: biotin/lipoyl-containing protein [Bryobacteraceae bacterium]|jgi:biotin carboxyl carrier protein
MKLDLEIDGVAAAIDLVATTPECRFRVNDGEERRADVAEVTPGVYSVLLDGRSYEARVDQTPDGLVVVVNGTRFPIEVRDPRRWSARSGGRAGDGVQNLLAPMPGKVVRVLAKPGDMVEAGQGILVVEAMKMQNEMRAGRAGRVLSIAVQEGATVKADEVLARIG